MKVLIDTYPLAMQNDSGGIQVRIKQHKAKLIEKGIDVKFFDKWNDKIEDYDVYHLFKVSTDSYSKLLYAHKKGVKTVVSAVVPLDKKFNIQFSLFLASKFKLSLHHEFIRKTLDLADVITTQTEQEKNFINIYYKIGIDKILVIPNGVNEFFLNNKSLSLSLKNKFNINEPYVLQVGRVDSNKNQYRVIEALKNTNIPVVFIGGPDFNDYEYYEKCKQALGKNMIMTGWIQNDSELMRSAYREAKVVILPSLYETFGNALVEGGVSGANIACSRTLAINEYPISRLWSKFDPLDSDSIKRNILMEYNKPLNIEMKEEFILTFSWSIIIKYYIKIYKDLYESR